jgi:FLVCR family feline leukemia virus subgroup C receptor-related protein
MVLGAFMLLALAMQSQWLALTPVARPAQRFYGAQLHPGALLGVDSLALASLVAYLVLSLPASRFLAQAGLGRGIAVGALLGCAGAVLKATGAADFRLVLSGQVLLGAAGPFVLNATTALCARWFPQDRRALAVSLANLAQCLGLGVAMVLGPALVVGDPGSTRYGHGVVRLLWVNGALTLATGLLCLVLVREPGGAGAEAGPAPGAQGSVRALLRNRDFRLLLGLAVVCLGIYNTLLGMEDAVAAHIGAVSSDGRLGAWLIGGGILGAPVLPALSDRFRRRRPFLTFGLGGMVPGAAGLAWSGRVAPDPASAYLLAQLAAGVLGFFLIGAGSLGLQYAAEITQPLPEVTSQALLLMVGQVSGAVLMALMSRSSLVGPVLVGFTILVALGCAASRSLPESPVWNRRV